MKRSFITALIAATAAAAALAGCYVIPIDPLNPPPPGAVLASHSPGGAAPALPVRPVPAVLRARLYPMNDMAGKMGALSATVTDSANGHGVFSLTHGGETFRGEASRIAGQRGIASAAGSAGTYVNCEYALSGPDRGTGACLFSNGAKYELHFGS